MVRAGSPIGAGLLLSVTLAASPAPSQPAAPAAFEAVASRDFDELFNREVERRGAPGRLSKSTCAGANCSYLFKSVAVLVSPTAVGDRLDGVTWFCGKDCKPLDFVLGISLSLRILVPGLPDAQYNAWLGEATEAMKGNRKSETRVGPATVKVGVYGDLGLMAFITK